MASHGNTRYIIDAPPQWGIVVKRLLKPPVVHHIFCLAGELGTGKTTLARAFCRGLGVEGGISSPTFGIVNSYQGDDGISIAHFDLYRIQKLQELLELGFEDYLYSHTYTLIEWHKIAMPLLPKPYLQLQLGHLGQGRSVELQEVR
jgi:tRNA threonylcarbamoyladenosine biosynthesis protein TsaE